MTSPHVSEQEVEAAARAIHKIWYDKWPNPECTQCMGVARAALTAAAQVRGRENMDTADPPRSPSHLPSTIQRAVTEPDSGPDVLGERKGIIGNFDEK